MTNDINEFLSMGFARVEGEMCGKGVWVADSNRMHCMK